MGEGYRRKPRRSGWPGTRPAHRTTVVATDSSAGMEGVTPPPASEPQARFSPPSGVSANGTETVCLRQTPAGGGVTLSRRSLFQRTLTALASVMLLRGLFKAEAQASQQPEGDHASRPHRWGMVIDLDKCTGCQACVVACWAENNQPLPSPEAHREGRRIKWMMLLPFQEGQYPSVHQRLMPIPCQHCDQPPCTPVCPVFATYKNPEGLVAQIYPRCIGCRYCVNACPYTCKFFNWSKPEWPAPMAQMLNPDVSVRPKGVTEKCTFCHHNLQPP